MTDVVAPLAWTAFEMNQPTFDRQATISLVNLYVNATILAIPGAPPAMDEYIVWPRSGYCHDFAITKRYELLLRGFQPSDLQLCVCIAHGIPHMVLIADGQVMDSLNPRVRPLAQLGYRIVKLQSTANPDIWTDGTVTA
jgi:predicted transglutaminase-like cysteine proteinase